MQCENNNFGMCSFVRIFCSFTIHDFDLILSIRFGRKLKELTEQKYTFGL